MKNTSVVYHYPTPMPKIVVCAIWFFVIACIAVPLAGYIPAIISASISSSSSSLISLFTTALIHIYIYLMVLYGLYTGRRWAWYSFTYAISAYLVFLIYTQLAGHSHHDNSLRIISTLLTLVPLMMMLTKTGRQWFEKCHDTRLAYKEKNIKSKRKPLVILGLIVFILLLISILFIRLYFFI